MSRKSFFDRPLAITDIETTGLKSRWHEIIEIGLVVVDQPSFSVISELELKVAPLHPERAEPEALAVNGYNAVDWSGAVTLAEAMRQYAALTSGAIFLAHNATFDWSFITAAFYGCKIKSPLDRFRIDLMTVAWTKLHASPPASMKLSELAKLLGIPPEPDVHRAINGARLAHQVLQALLKQ